MITFRLGLLLLPLVAFSQITTPGGSCNVTGTQTSGYVLTATDNSRGCSWQTVGGASVDNNTLKNAWYIADGGSANTITGTTTTAFPGAYAVGQAVIVRVAANNTGATTININSLGTKAVTKLGATALASGNLIATRDYLMAYDGTQFQVLNPTGVAADFPTLNQSTTGNAATSTALASTPSLCTTGNAPTGVLANGNATGCASIGGGGISGLTTNVIPKATSSTAIGNSSLSDNGATVSTAENLASGAGTTAGGSVTLGNSTGDTAPSFLVVNSGDGASNTEPGYITLVNSDSTKHQASLFACNNASGFLCISSAAPTANATNPIATKSGATTTNNCAKWDASGNLVDNGATCGAGGGGSPAGASGTYQYNNSGSFGGQGFIMASTLGTELQRAHDEVYAVLTQGGNLTLPTQTTNYSVALPTAAVSCNTRFTRALISVTTQFTGGTGGIWARLDHGSVPLTSQFDLTQSSGDVNFYPDVPGLGCMGSGTATLQLTFIGDGSHNLSGYTAGAVTIEVEGHAAR